MHSGTSQATGLPPIMVLADLGISGHVRFLGERGDVSRLLSAVDLVLMPSQSEGLGLAAIEALAAARPVIAFAVGGLPEVVVDGLNGRLVDCYRMALAP